MGKKILLNFFIFASIFLLGGKTSLAYDGNSLLQSIPYVNDILSNYLPATDPPKEAEKNIFLKLTAPTAGTKLLSNNTIFFKGYTLPNIRVYVADKVVKSDGKGYFETQLNLSKDHNLIIIRAQDKYDNIADQIFTITFKSS